MLFAGYQILKPCQIKRNIHLIARDNALKPFTITAYLESCTFRPTSARANSWRNQSFGGSKPRNWRNVVTIGTFCSCVSKKTFEDSSNVQRRRTVKMRLRRSSKLMAPKAGSGISSITGIANWKQRFVVDTQNHNVYQSFIRIYKD